MSTNNTGFVPSQELLKDQGLMLNIAKEFKRLCEKHNLPYFMAFGTVLGSIRHKGFIPWDDDMGHHAAI